MSGNAISKPPRHIALLQFGGIGDVLLFSAVIQELKTWLPETKLTLFLEDRSRAVADVLPAVDHVEAVKVQGTSRKALFLHLIKTLRRLKPDAVISTGSSPFIPPMLLLSGVPHRTGYQTGWTSRQFLTVEAPLDRAAYAGDMYFSLARSFLCNVLGEAYRPPETVLPVVREIQDEERAFAEGLLSQGAPGKARILVHPGVSRVSVEKKIFKSWPVERWAALVGQLAAEGYAVYLVGGPDDRDAVAGILERLGPDSRNVTNLYGKTRSLRDFAALVSQADALLAVDSSPLHVAVGLKRPVVAMFGPTDPKKLVPQHPLVKAVYRDDLACRPCLWDVRQVNCDASTCLDVSIADMRRGLDQVLAAQLPSPH